MRKLKSPRTWLLLALTGITMMALSIVQMTSAEAAAPNKPHTLTGVAHHDKVVLHWSSELISEVVEIENAQVEEMA